MRTIWRFIKWLFYFCFVLGLLGGIAATSFGVYYYLQIVEGLPKIAKISDYRPKAVTRVLSSEGELVAEIFDEDEKRYPVSLDQVPLIVQRAFLAAEDANFYSHPGIDIVSVLRALWKNLHRNASVQGASTITQQVVKSLLLTPERTYTRKAKEAILSYRLEKALSKEEILTLYLNQIYLGNGASGIQAAAWAHFRKKLKDINIAEAAFLGGLPQRPSVLSRPQNRQLAIDRQRYVLGEMLDKKFITENEFKEAQAEELKLYPPDDTVFHGAPYYAAEIVKSIDKYLPEGVSAKDPGGLTIKTAVSLRATEIAERALRQNLRELDKREGWRGPLERELNPENGTSSKEGEDLVPGSDNLHRALITSVDKKSKVATVRLGKRSGFLDLTEASWARSLIFKKGTPISDPVIRPIKLEEYLQAGDLVEVSWDEEKSLKTIKPGGANKGDLWFKLDQTPDVQGAMVLFNALTGETPVLIGGYDYKDSVFNRATQGLRQPGSSFKPIIYLTAIEQKGFTPSTIVPDSPISLRAGNGKLWQPQNYDRKYLGPITLRTALQRSRNVVSVYLVSQVGVQKIWETARRLGISAPLVADYSIALGTAEVKLTEMVRAYGAFAAGGWLLEPRYVTEIQDRDGKVIYLSRPSYREVIDEDKAFLMAHMMKGVVDRGTAQVVKQLGRPVAGKTGTTNDQMDAWFIGYTPEWVAGVWVGFDQKRSLGRFETGGKAAAPAFVYFMEKFLKGTPESDFEIPDGVIPVAVNVESGRLAQEGDPKAFVEYFISGTEPMFYEEEAKAPSDYLSGDEF